MTKQLTLIATCAALLFLALTAWSTQLEVTHYEEAQRQLHAPAVEGYDQ